MPRRPGSQIRERALGNCCHIERVCGRVGGHSARTGRYRKRATTSAREGGAAKRSGRVARIENAAGRHHVELECIGGGWHEVAVDIHDQIRVIGREGVDGALGARPDNRGVGNGQAIRRIQRGNERLRLTGRPHRQIGQLPFFGNCGEVERISRSVPWYTAGAGGDRDRAGSSATDKRATEGSVGLPRIHNPARHYCDELESRRVIFGGRSRAGRSACPKEHSGGAHEEARSSHKRSSHKRLRPLSG